MFPSKICTNLEIVCIGTERAIMAGNLLECMPYLTGNWFKASLNSDTNQVFYGKAVTNDDHGGSMWVLTLSSHRS